MSASAEPLTTTIFRMIDERNNALYKLYLDYCEKNISEKEYIATKEEFQKVIDFMDENIEYNSVDFNGLIWSSTTIKDFKKNNK